MTSPLAIDRFTTELFAILEETFEQVHGIYLDRNTSLFETLNTVTAAEASRSISVHGASIAAQVNHVRYYLDVLSGYMRQQPMETVDWQASWDVAAVTPPEWEALKQHLKASYSQVLTMLKGFERWDGEEDIAGALAIVVHTAYHLGEIRQALGIIRAAHSPPTT